MKKSRPLRKIRTFALFLPKKNYIMLKLLIKVSIIAHDHA